MASYNRTLTLADNSVAVRRGGAGEEDLCWVAEWPESVPIIRPKWEVAGSSTGLGAEGNFGQPARNAGHLPIGFRLCGASHCATTHPPQPLHVILGWDSFSSLHT